MKEFLYHKNFLDNEKVFAYLCISPKTGKLVKANLPASVIDHMLECNPKVAWSTFLIYLVKSLLI